MTNTTITFISKEEWEKTKNEPHITLIIDGEPDYYTKRHILGCGHPHVMYIKKRENKFERGQREEWMKDSSQICSNCVQQLNEIDKKKQEGK